MNDQQIEKHRLREESMDALRELQKLTIMGALITDLEELQPIIDRRTELSEKLNQISQKIEQLGLDPIEAELETKRLKNSSELLKSIIFNGAVIEENINKMKSKMRQNLPKTEVGQAMKSYLRNQRK